MPTNSDPLGVVVGMPCYGSVDPATLVSLIGVLCSDIELVRDFICMPFMYVDAARNEITRQALRVSSATHLMFLDNDMVWPHNTISRLATHRVPVVGGNYFLKVPPHDCVAFNIVELSDGVQIVRLEDFTPNLAVELLFEVEGLGLGATLIDLDVLRRMKDHFHDEKWFRSEEGGEDVWFFRRLRQLGIPAPVWLDTSLKCGHIASQVITEDDWIKSYPDSRLAKLLRVEENDL